MTWLERLKRVFAIDLSNGPDYGGQLRVIADVTRPDSMFNNEGIGGAVGLISVEDWDRTQGGVCSWA